MTIDHDELALEVAKDFTSDISTHNSLIDFARRYRKALAEKMEPIPMDKETYTLQLKEAWESGFRCGLREARQEEV